MPNQRAAGRATISITMDKALWARVKESSRKSQVPASRIIETMVRAQLDEHVEYQRFLSDPSRRKLIQAMATNPEVMRGINEFVENTDRGVVQLAITDYDEALKTAGKAEEKETPELPIKTRSRPAPKSRK